MDLYVIYLNPSDFPGRVLVRKYLCNGDGVSIASVVDFFPSVSEAREALSKKGLIRISRHTGDDPVIVERWV